MGGPGPTDSVRVASRTDERRYPASEVRREMAVVRTRWLILGAAALATVLAATGDPDPAVAQSDQPEEQATEQALDPRWDNDYCFGCHDAPGFQTELPSGEVFPLDVPREVFDDSVHGELGLSCVLCHSDITPYPHAPLEIESTREFTVGTFALCTTCHDEQYSATHDNVHAAALADGNIEAPVCADCHGAHDIQRHSSRATAIQETCRNCHFDIYNLYAESVHGAALFEEDNTDVPTCTDCHGVHDVSGPAQSGFHLFSPEICAGCHEDQELMGRYDISTDVFDTYVADFHGSTVLIFEELFPDQETNKPVCIDCHGVHNIASADNPESQTFRANLLATCQRCHPDATENFPTAWLSHYRPSVASAPLVFLVDLFYEIVIPLAIGLAIVWVILDFFRMRADRRRRRASHA